MPKKAKRRGRPPGSKNKKAIGKSIVMMDVGQLRARELIGFLASIGETAYLDLIRPTAAA
jgi:hypothetical protein